MTNTYKKFRVGIFTSDRITPEYFYTDNNIEAYEKFIEHRSTGEETWYDKLVKDEYETVETYYPEDEYEK